MTVHLLTGDCREVLRALPADSVHCVVTSPPYWGLRIYAGDLAGQIGLEPTLGEHIAVLVEVMREVRRVLRPDGTVWLNYGDCYATSPNGRSAAATKAAGGDDRTFRDKPFSTIGPIYDPNHRVVTSRQRNRDHGIAASGGRVVAAGLLKPKDLVMAANRLAIALQDDGWWVRSETIWAKPNPMPESVTDRPAVAHEKVFLLTKVGRYYYDAQAVRQETTGNAHRRRKDGERRPAKGSDAKDNRPGTWRDTYLPSGRNLTTVWTIPTAPFADAHFATFPPRLVELCVAAGTSAHGVCSVCGAPWKRVLGEPEPAEGRGSGNLVRTPGEDRIAGASHVGRGFPWEPSERPSLGWQPTCTCEGADVVPATVLDPFGGAGTVAMVADRMQRSAISIDLSGEYIDIARRRCCGDGGLLTDLRETLP